MAAVSFDDFITGIRRLGVTVILDEENRARIDETATYLQQLAEVTRDAVAQYLVDHPERVPLVALCVGLSQEQLKNTLRHRMGSSSWERLARSRSEEVVRLLDDEFGLINQIEKQRARQWSFADILAERFASRLRAAGSIKRGRSVEDEVQRIAAELGLETVMRTRFSGRANRTAPCDLAIPEGGDGAQVVCGIKGFDSTGSKLTDAAREVEEMADVRKPSQYVFVVADGIGWLSRQADLRRIHALWKSGAIDGLYTLSSLPDFKRDVKAAARRLGLL